MARSEILRAMTRDGSARIHVIDSTAMVARMAEIHKSAPTASAAGGRLLTAAAILGSMCGEVQDTVSVTVAGDGPIGKLDVGGAVGRGRLTVVRSMGQAEPHIGTVQLRSGEIAEDIAAYFAESEQIPTLLSLGVLVDKDASIRAAGGVLIQLLPFADEAVIAKLEENAASISNVSHLIDSGKTLTDIADLALAGIPYDPFDTIGVAYKCDCSRDRMRRALISVGKRDLAQMFSEQEKEGKPRCLELSCRFCGASFAFAEKDLGLDA